MSTNVLSRRLPPFRTNLDVVIQHTPDLTYSGVHPTPYPSPAKNGGRILFVLSPCDSLQFPSHIPYESRSPP